MQITEERRNIQRAQRMLGISADGIFGPQTLSTLQTRLLGAAQAPAPSNVLAFPAVAATPTSPEPPIRLVEGPDRDDSDILDWIERSPTAPSRIEVLTSTKGISYREAARHLMDEERML